MDDLFRLAEKLDELEKLRKACLKTIGVIAVCELIILALVVGFYLLTGVINRLTSALFFLPGLFSYTLAFDRRRYKKVYNSVIVRQSLERYFEIHEFNSDYGIPYGVILGTGMIRQCKYFTANDFLQGTYKDVEFMQSDVIMRTQDPKVSRSSVTLFSGRWMIFEFNKNFVCDLLIYEKGIRFAKKGNVFSPDRLEKLQFENMSFNEHFRAYTDNQNDAFYIVTPHIMEMLEEIRENVRGDLIIIFHRNRLHIGVNNYRDAFEPPLFHPIDVQSLTGEIDEDIGLITKMVDGLKLDEKIYKV